MLTESCFTQYRLHGFLCVSCGADIGRFIYSIHCRLRKGAYLSISQIPFGYSFLYSSSLT